MSKRISNLAATLEKRIKHTTITQLARASGVSRATIYAILDDRCKPTVATLIALGKVLRVRLIDLVE